MADEPGRPLHSLLLRQLKRLGISPDDAPDPRWTEFLKRVDRTYREDEEGRYLLERSLDLSSKEMHELNARLAADRNRLERELEIARNLQVSILPRDLHSPTFEAVGRMIPATEVGGDYYDVVPLDDGCWIAIGDVAGHGLRAAVIMTMVQSMVSSLIRQTPDASPSQLTITLNRAIHENVFRRLRTQDHVTFSLLRCHADGTITFAGAHEPIVIRRAREGRFEAIETSGTWLGPLRDITSVTKDQCCRLEPGDLMALHTDGITEARNVRRELYGFDRLLQAIEEHHAEPLDTMCDHVLDGVRGWMSTQEDDMTLFVLRRLAG